MPENIDLLYRIASAASTVIERFFTAGLFVYLCRDFRKEKRGTWLIGGAYFAVILTLYFMPVFLSASLAYFLAAFAGFMVFIRTERENMRMKIFLTVTFFVVDRVLSSLTVTVGRMISGGTLNVMRMIRNMDESSAWLAYYLERAANFLFEDAMYAVLFYLFLRKLKQMIYDKETDLEWMEFFILLIPSVNGIIIRKIVSVYVFFYEEEHRISVFHLNIGNDFLWISCYAVILASIISTIFLYQKIRRKREEEYAASLLENQMKDIRLHIAEVEKMYADIRGVKHDINNHIEVMNSLLSQGKTQAAKDYAGSLAGAVSRFELSVKTGNPVTDVILHEKRNQAQRKKIEFESDFSFPAESGIDAFDVSVIVSNALSNAIEAAGEGGYVKISSFRNKNVCLITVENSFDGTLTLGRESGLPNTKKEDKKSHGYGLRNMKSVAEKYYGDVQIAQKGNCVITKVMLLASA